MQDRHYLGTSGRLHDGEAAAYILTLGVAAGWRKCGVASALLSLVYQHATNAQCVCLPTAWQPAGFALGWADLLYGCGRDVVCAGSMHGQSS